MLCTSDIYCYYLDLHMYMSSAYYLGICILYTHYLQWSLICSFLTDNANVIHTSSLVHFIYPIMYNLVSAHCLHRYTLSMLSAHVHIICLSSLTLLVFHYNLIPALETQRLKKSKKLAYMIGYIKSTRDDIDITDYLANHLYDPEMKQLNILVTNSIQ